MSNYRHQAPPSASANDNPHTRRPEMRITEVEETSGMVMIAHYDDARLSPNNNQIRGKNNSTLISAPEQQRAANTYTATTCTAASNNDYVSPYAAATTVTTIKTRNTNTNSFNNNENPPPPWAPAISSSTSTSTRARAGGNHTCTHCSSAGHRRPECPHLPCKHCDLMGHIGIDCPEMDKVRAERRQMTSKRWYENNRGANRK